MTDLAIHQTTAALKRLLERALETVLPDDLEQQGIHVGPPIASEVGSRIASLFLFHLQPNAELRNEPRFSSPPATSAATGPAELRNALPLDLHYLITVFPINPNSGFSEPNDLAILGRIMQAIHTEPTLAGATLSDQMVRLTPEPYPMEEMSRIWSLFPDNVYRTSIVYLASPVFVEAGAPEYGPPVQKRQQRMGVGRGLPNVLGTAQAGASDGTP
jgi:hypothetical protein